MCSMISSKRRALVWLLDQAVDLVEYAMLSSVLMLVGRVLDFALRCG